MPAPEARKMLELANEAFSGWMMMLPDRENAPAGPDKWPTFGISTLSGWLESTDRVIFFPAERTGEVSCFGDGEEELQGAEQLTVRRETPISIITIILLRITTITSDPTHKGSSAPPRTSVCWYDLTLVSISTHISSD